MKKNSLDKMGSFMGFTGNIVFHSKNIITTAKYDGNMMCKDTVQQQHLVNLPLLKMKPALYQITLMERVWSAKAIA